MSDTPVDEQMFEFLKGALRSRGELSVVLKGESMMPLIQPGTNVKIVPVQGPLRRFDIVVFLQPHKKILIAHYLWHVNHLQTREGEDIIVTRALNGGAEDFPVPSSRILGLIAGQRLPLWTRLRLSFGRS
ncbi:MAG TPA: S24/S26 family peptidase [Bdellovibrionales bacterium]|nr:S24/S26 family peptidase [Bdellovibrionales bacterium]